jgi:3-hydroxyisobutyrate dehydrogenase-like beta-hydroxyacid dehydrogenase
LVSIETQSKISTEIHLDTVATARQCPAHNVASPHTFRNDGEDFMKTGFIGLGRMGSAMATNLLKAGHDVTVFNRSPEKREALVKLGAHEAARISDACRGEVVITMLADDNAVSNVVLGKGGLIESLAKGAIHVSMSTISVALAKELAHAHAAAGQRFVSAPVFGRPEAAEAAKLFIVTGGDPTTLKACQPLFDAIGQKTTAISKEPQAANLVKVSGNFLIASTIEALGEAIALVGKAGIDRNAYVDFLSSTIFPTPAHQIYGKLIAAGKFEPAAFTAPLGYKDVRLAQAAADELRVPMPLASLLHERFLRLLARDGDSLDWAAIGGLASLDAGDTRAFQDFN